MNDKLNIDKIISEKLEGFSAAPPSHVWDNIQGQMAAQKRKKRAAYISWIAAAAVVVFAFIAGWVLNERADKILPETVEQQIEKPIEKFGKEKGNASVADAGDEDTFVAETNLKEPNQDIIETTSKVNKVKEVNTIEDEYSIVASVERISYELLKKIEAVFTIEQLDVYLAEHKRQQSELGISTYDEMLIAENIRNTKKQENTENGWLVGTLISPGYASYSSSHSEQYAQNITYTGNDGGGNVGAGFSVQYKTSKRLKVESGVYYSQNGQSSNNSSGGLFAFNDNADYALAAGDAIGDSKTGFSNTVQLSNDGIAMNSTAGVINMRSAPQGALVATNAEATNSRYNNTLTTSGEFSQEFQFVEIPMYLRYSVLDKKFGVELIGGFNAELVVGNNAYIDNEFGKQNIGSTADISTLNLSGTVGVGMNYALGKQFSLALEPRFNYFLNSINSNPDVDFRPYRIGVFTGVYYEF